MTDPADMTLVELLGRLASRVDCITAEMDPEHPCDCDGYVLARECRARAARLREAIEAARAAEKTAADEGWDGQEDRAKATWQALEAINAPGEGRCRRG